MGFSGEKLCEYVCVCVYVCVCACTGYSSEGAFELSRLYQTIHSDHEVCVCVCVCVCACVWTRDWWMHPRTVPCTKLGWSVYVSSHVWCVCVCVCVCVITLIGW